MRFQLDHIQNCVDYVITEKKESQGRIYYKKLVEFIMEIDTFLLNYLSLTWYSYGSET